MTSTRESRQDTPAQQIEVDPGWLEDLDTPAPGTDEATTWIAAHWPQDPAALAAAVRERCDAGGCDRAFVVLDAVAGDEDLAALRNAAWPTLHVSRILRGVRGAPLERIDVDGRRRLTSIASRDGCVLAVVRRATAMSKTFTQQKFDAKAAGWNGFPGTPSYGHFRWMRRLLSDLAPPAPFDAVLDAGSGAGWVGIEAGRKQPLSRLAAFDPSSEMARFVRENAEDCRLEVDARVGFVEDPPFEETFDTVYNSGVISFAPDPTRFLDGLDRVVKPGGRLVIGDLNPLSWGFARRRRMRPVLPTRELSGVKREWVVAELARRGYEVESVHYYQLTWPIPEIIHRSQSRLVQALLLAANRIAVALDGAFGSPGHPLFDSWIVVARRHA
jgi:SAM-dependent methyltransferase